MLHGSNIYQLWWILLLILFGVYLYLKKRISRPGEVNIKRIEDMNKPEETAGYIYSILRNKGFSDFMAKVISAQAAFETGNFTSLIWKENNNLFGMKEPQVRDTTATGTNRNHATYNDIEDSLEDFILYYQYFEYPEGFETIEDYVKALKEKGYFEAPFGQYLQGVQYYYKLYYNE